ncbi:hypothetical protein [Isoptericola croceus]|uniref:hypothetical protein n=1 Tax=Isoptericola croceus TaxID=3031406 RepID=UPI0023F8A15D|nr:hypothetical protein [Isoptericola croceus]
MQLTGLASSLFPRPVPAAFLMLAPAAYGAAVALSTDSDRVLELGRPVRLILARLVWFAAVVGFSGALAACLTWFSGAGLMAAVTNLLWFVTLSTMGAISGFVSLSWTAPALHVGFAMLFASSDIDEFTWWAWILDDHVSTPRIIGSAASVLVVGLLYACYGAYDRK